MKKSFALLSALLLTGAMMTSRAAVIYTDCTDQTVTATNSVSVDMNNDGTVEFTLSDLGMGGGVTAYTTFDNTLLNFVTWSSSTDWDVFKNVPYGTAIGSTSGFYTYGDCYFNPDYATNLIPTGSDQYIGVEFKVSGNWRYGWVRVLISATGEVTIKDYAYENTAGTSILAGSTGSTTGISDLTDEVSFTAGPNPVKDVVTLSFPGKVMFSLRLFNSTGQVVMESNTLISGETSLQWNLSALASGVYYIEAITPGDERLMEKIIKE